jgi:hypothetical protein
MISKIFLGLITLTTLAYSAPASARVLFCATDDLDAEPYYTFTVTIHELPTNSTASVRAHRLPKFGVRMLPQSFDITGCQNSHAQFKFVRRSTVVRSISIECAGDGDAGYLNLTKSKNGFKGKIGFPEGAHEAGISEDSEFAVTCKKIDAPEPRGMDNR